LFKGSVIEPSDFTIFSTAEYGNCFTLDLDWIKATGSGLRNGVRLVLNVERQEYLPDSSTGYGVRMVVHEKGTMPLPQNEGLTLSTEYETSIGLRMVQINRLGGKYGSCTDGEDFLKKHQLNYTVALCYTMCEISLTELECGCTPVSTPDVYDTDVSVCDIVNYTIRSCVENVNGRVLNRYVECDCPTRCSEQVYTYSFSGRKWPHEQYLYVLINEVCRSNYTQTFYTDLCERYEKYNLTDYDVKMMFGNFMAVNVYFEDLNYDLMQEEPLYNTVRFLSDIGGTMGLFTGASALTYCEILQIIVEIGIFFRNRRRQTVNNIN